MLSAAAAQGSRVEGELGLDGRLGAVRRARTDARNGKDDLAVSCSFLSAIPYPSFTILLAAMLASSSFAAAKKVCAPAFCLSFGLVRWAELASSSPTHPRPSRVRLPSSERSPRRRPPTHDRPRRRRQQDTRARVSQSSETTDSTSATLCAETTSRRLSSPRWGTPPSPYPLLPFLPLQSTSCPDLLPTLVLITDLDFPPSSSIRFRPVGRSPPSKRTSEGSSCTPSARRPGAPTSASAGEEVARTEQRARRARRRPSWCVSFDQRRRFPSRAAHTR